MSDEGGGRRGGRCRSARREDSNNNMCSLCACERVSTLPTLETELINFIFQFISGSCRNLYDVYVRETPFLVNHQQVQNILGNKFAK